MATRYNYTGQLITDGLVLNLDAAKRDSYPGSGTTWYDLSGNGNNGTLTNGPTYTGVSKDAAIVFDGTDDYGSFPTDNLPSGNSEISYNCWFKWDGTFSTSFGDFILSYGNDVGPNRVPLILISNNGNKILFEFGSSSGAVTSSISINSGSIVNITATYDKSFNKLYINGSPNASVSYNSANITPLGSNGYTGGLGTLFSVYGNIGSGATRRYGAYDGNISTAQIYNEALSQFDIWQNFNALKGRYGIPDIVTDGLVLNLDAGNPYSYLSGSSGTTWTDVSGEGNNGTLTNGASYENGSIVFDGTDDYVTLPGIITLTDFTATAVYKVTSLNDGWAMFFGSTDSDNFIAIGNNGVILRVQDKNSDNSDLSYTSILDQITILQVVQSGNTNTWYINGTSVGTSTNSTYAGMEIDRMVHYRDGDSLGIWAGNYYYANLYNRALTQDEITQNFNALRGRYGI